MLTWIPSIARRSPFLPTAVACFIAGALCPTAKAQVAYTQTWQLTPKLEHGFVVGHPRDWNVLDLLPETLRFEAPPSTGPGGRASCGVAFSTHTGFPSPPTQSEIDAAVNRAPLSEAAAEMFGTRFRAAGASVAIIGRSRDRVAGRPAHVVEFETTFRHPEGDIHVRTLMAELYTPRQRFVLDCSATARSNSEADRFYIRWLPTFRAFLETFSLFSRS